MHSDGSAVADPISVNTSGTNVTLSIDLTTAMASTVYHYQCTDGTAANTFNSNTFTIEVLETILTTTDLCEYDLIELTTESVSSFDPNSKYYKSINSIPRLVISQSTGETLSVDVSSRFTHNTTNCTMSNYRISHVVTNDGSNLT